MRARLRRLTFRMPGRYLQAPRSWLLGAVLTLLLLAGAAFAAAPAEATRVLTLSYDFAPPQIESTNGRARIAVPGCETLNRPGETALPFRTARILLPPGFTVAQVTTEPTRPPAAMPGTWRFERGQWLPRPQGTNDNAPRRPPQARAAFASRQGQDGSGQLLSIQRWLGCDIALVRLSPVEFKAAGGQLYFSPKLSVTLALSSSNAKLATVMPNCGQARARERVAAWVDNPALISEYETSQITKTADTPPRYDYLLVTRSALVPSFQPLVERKITAGLAVKIETMEAITASQPGRDIPEKLRNYIRHAFTNWGVQFVLLGGDTATVPTRYAYVPQRLSEKDCLVPCDLYFACLDGTWNRDDDNRWGEPTDGEDVGEVDLLAEVYVGRAPVDTPAEVAAFVEKTIRHETAKRTDDAGVLLAGTYLEHASAQGGDMFDPLLPVLKPFALHRLDDRPEKAPRWTSADALRELSRSPRLVLYSGHADSDKIMRLSRADLPALSNQHPFLLYSVGCNAGQYDNDPFSADCIAEELVKMEGCGAFATICNPRVGWYDPREVERFSGQFQAAFLKELLAPNHAHLAQASQLARHKLLGLVESRGLMPYRWCYYEITLLGDPSIVVDLAASK